jgi:hypothetical protein
MNFCLSELADVAKKFLTQKKTNLNTGGSPKVSLYCELSHVSSRHLTAKMTFYNVSSCAVSHQCDLLNVSAIVENHQRF